jgi:hypothetical protein
MTDHRPFVALAPVIGLAVYCVSHVVAARIIRGRNPYPALAVGALAGLVATIAITLAACSHRQQSDLPIWKPPRPNSPR